MATLQDPNSFLNESQLQKVNKEFKYVVFGYIREQQNNHSFDIIPKLVMFIILAFYADISDEFDKTLCGDNVKISVDGKSIIHFQKNYSSNTSYGKKIINSMDDGIYIWRLKLFDDKNYEMNIGIDNAKAKYVNGNLYSNKDKASYAYCASEPYVFKWNENTPKRNANIYKFSKSGEILKLQLLNKQKMVY